MDQNLGIYWAVSHETWQSGSSGAPTKSICGNFENFDFLARGAAQKVQIWAFPHFLTFCAKFSKFLHNVLVGASDEPDCQVS